MKKVAFVFASVLLALSTSAISGEFGNRCTTGLTKGVVVNSDCSIQESFKGNTFCFGNQEAKTAFLETKDKQKFIDSAAMFYPKVLSGMAK